MREKCGWLVKKVRKFWKWQESPDPETEVDTEADTEADTEVT